MPRVILKTPCASAALNYFGVSGATWNNRTKKNVWKDTLRRGGFSVRSRMSKMPKNASVTKCRKKLAQIAKEEPLIKGFIVCVRGHVLVVNRLGKTIVDTDPRKIDRRKVVGVTAVFWF